jgi:hypothetical protein
VAPAGRGPAEVVEDPGRVEVGATVPAPGPEQAEPGKDRARAVLAVPAPDRAQAKRVSRLLGTPRWS